MLILIDDYICIMNVITNSYIYLVLIATVIFIDFTSDAQVACLNSAITTFGQQSCWNSTDLLIRVTGGWIGDTSSFHEIIKIKVFLRSCADHLNALTVSMIT